MKRVLLIIFFVICTNNYLFGQPKDIDGWNKTRWGMTENEVLEALEGKATTIGEPKKYKNGYSPIVLKEIQINDHKYTANFVFDNNNKKLVMVIIEFDNTPFEVNFTTLEQMLVGKYGAPSFKNDNVMPPRGGSRLPDKALTRSWNFPSTIIELNYVDLKIFKPTLQIIYKKNIKETRDNL